MAPFLLSEGTLGLTLRQRRGWEKSNMKSSRQLGKVSLCCFISFLFYFFHIHPLSFCFIGSVDFYVKSRIRLEVFFCNDTSCAKFVPRYMRKTESTSSATRSHLLPHLCWKRRGRSAGWAFQARDSPDITDRVSGVLGELRPSTVHSLFFRDNWHILKTAILLHLYMYTQARAAAGGPEARRGEGFLKLGPASRHLPALAFQLRLALRFRRRFKVSLMERVYAGG